MEQHTEMPSVDYDDVSLHRAVCQVRHHLVAAFGELVKEGSYALKVHALPCLA